MSFLLDALRKSERAGRARAAPTIHSPAPAPAVTGRGVEWVPLFLVLVPAFFFMSWLGLEQFGVFSDLAPAPVPQVTRVEPGAGGPDAGSGTKRAAAASQRRVESDVEATTTAPPERGRRTPVEQAPAPPPAASGASENEPATQPRSQPRQAAATEAAQREPASAGSARSTDQRSTSVTPSQRTTRRNHIDYWDLPGNVRGQLPEFQINVLVYAEDPAERFILVNGQRQYEGDALQPGLELDEIRRDGVIYTYRRYRFLVRQ